MGNTNFVGLREATAKTLRMGGTDLLSHPQRFKSYLLDIADQSQPEVRMVANQLDEELVAPLREACEHPEATALITAQTRVLETLKTERFVNSQMAHTASHALVGGLADYLGMPFADEPKTTPPASTVSAKPETSTPPPNQPTFPQPVSSQPAIRAANAVASGNTMTTQQPMAPIAQSAPQVPQQQKKAPVGAIAALVAIIAILAIALVVLLPRLQDTLGSSSTAASPNASVTSKQELSGQDSNDQNSNVEDEPHSLDGVSYPVGNLINGGHMASDSSENVYYANPIDGTDWDTNSLVRCNSKGEDRTTIYTAPSSTKNLYHINAVGDRLVFNQVIENNSTVECIGSDGSGHKTLASCDDWSLCQVDDGWVYYLKSGKLNRCDVDGGQSKTLANVGSKRLWRVCGKCLFTFDEEGASAIYKSNLDGTDRTKAYTSKSGYSVKNVIPLSADSLCVWEKGSSMRIVLVDLTSGNSKTLYSGNDIERFCTYDDGIIVTTKEGDGYHIYFVGYDGGDPVNYNPGKNQVRYTCQVNQGICYGVSTDSMQNSIMWVPLPGHGNGSYMMAD